MSRKWLEIEMNQKTEMRPNSFSSGKQVTMSIPLIPLNTAHKDFELSMRLKAIISSRTGDTSAISKNSAIFLSSFSHKKWACLFVEQTSSTPEEKCSKDVTFRMQSLHCKLGLVLSSHSFLIWIFGTDLQVYAVVVTEFNLFRSNSGRFT